jgi:hypothetical protein
VFLLSQNQHRPSYVASANSNVLSLFNTQVGGVSYFDLEKEMNGRKK